jgi:hypothetical protein
VFFKSQCSALGLWMKMSCEDFTCIFRGETSVKVTLRIEQVNEQNSDPSDRIVCDVLAERQPNETVRSMFESLSRREVPKGVNPRALPPGTLDENGKIRSLGHIVNHMPGPFEEFWSDMLSSMRDRAAQVISALRWRLNRPSQDCQRSCPPPPSMYRIAGDSSTNAANAIRWARASPALGRLV